MKESEQYGDILRGEFVDTYNNLTLKALLVLKYASEHCKQVPFLLKSDDDMLINIPYMVRVLRKHSLLKRSIIGHPNNSTVLRSGKWNISYNDFPFEFYAPYMSGAAYVMTMDIVGELFETSKYVPWIFIDDVYITGTLAKICNVTLRNMGDMAALKLWGTPNYCDVILERSVFKTNALPGKLNDIWRSLKTKSKDENVAICKKSKKHKKKKKHHK